MADVGIVIDSSVSVPQDLKDKLNIEIAPLRIHIDGNTYRDMIDIEDSNELFKLVKEAKTFPTTSAPPPGDYADIYRKLSKKTNRILTICMSSALSMTIKSVIKAKRMMEKEMPNINIEVFDSRTTVGAAGLIAIGAAQASIKGMDIDRITGICEDIRTRVNYLFVMDTLSYLARSGRISKAAATVGNMLSMKPITEINTSSGRPSVVTRPRTKKKALAILLDMIRERVNKDNNISMMVEHTGLSEDAEWLKKTIASEFKVKQGLIYQFSPVSTLIVGPGGVGVGFYEE